MQPLTSQTEPPPLPLIAPPPHLWHHLAPSHQRQLAHLVATLIQRMRGGGGGKEHTHER